jgi:hypothetical protein
MAAVPVLPPELLPHRGAVQVCRGTQGTNRSGVAGDAFSVRPHNNAASCTGIVDMGGFQVAGLVALILALGSCIEVPGA